MNNLIHHCLKKNSIIREYLKGIICFFIDIHSCFGVKQLSLSINNIGSKMNLILNNCGYQKLTLQNILMVVQH